MGSVIFLHNTMASRAVFDGVVARLKDIDAHAIDFRAHGARVEEHAPYSATDLVSDLERYVEEKGLSRFSIVGSSIGATVAVLYAQKHPEQVEKLVLMAFNPQAASFFERLKLSVQAAVLSRVGPTSLFVSHAMRALFVRAGSASPAIARWRAHFRSLPKLAIGAALRGWRDRPDVRHILPGIEARVLVLAGDQDPTCSPVLADATSRLLPRGHAMTIDNASHMAPVEQPDRFVSLAGPFLRAP
jgi:3-oxoadipate enol-lactonase